LAFLVICGCRRVLRELKPPTDLHEGRGDLKFRSPHPRILQPSLLSQLNWPSLPRRQRPGLSGHRVTLTVAQAAIRHHDFITRFKRAFREAERHTMIAAVVARAVDFDRLTIDRHRVVSRVARALGMERHREAQCHRVRRHARYCRRERGGRGWFRHREATGGLATIARAVHRHRENAIVAGREVLVAHQPLPQRPVAELGVIVRVEHDGLRHATHFGRRHKGGAVEVFAIGHADDRHENFLHARAAFGIGRGAADDLQLAHRRRQRRSRNLDGGRGVVYGQGDGGAGALAAVIGRHRRQGVLAIGHVLPCGIARQDACGQHEGPISHRRREEGGRGAPCLTIEVFAVAPALNTDLHRVGRGRGRVALHDAAQKRGEAAIDVAVADVAKAHAQIGARHGRGSRRDYHGERGRGGLAAGGAIIGHKANGARRDVGLGRGVVEAHRAQHLLIVREAVRAAQGESASRAVLRIGRRDVRARRGGAEAFRRAVLQVRNGDGRPRERRVIGIAYRERVGILD